MPTRTQPISTNSAAYKRWQQKANAMAYDDPQKFRIMMSLVDDKFAGEQMQKRILNLRRTMVRERRDKTFDLASRRLASNIGLQRRTTKQEKSALSTAKTLGAINVPLSGLFGYMQYQGDVAEARDIRDLRSRIYPEAKPRKTRSPYRPYSGPSRNP